MAIVVELIKRKNEKPFWAEVNNVNDIELNDGVLFSQENNTDFGIVVKKPFEKDCSKIKNISKIISRANNQDWEKYNDILKKEKDAFPKIISAVEKLGLELKLIDVKISFDLSKMTVFLQKSKKYCESTCSCRGNVYNHTVFQNSKQQVNL